MHAPRRYPRDPFEHRIPFVRALGLGLVMALAAPLVGCEAWLTKDKKSQRDDDDDDDRTRRKKASAEAEADDDEPDPEVARLIGVLAEENASGRTRVDAAEALGKLGAKAKKPLEAAWALHKTESDVDAKARIAFVHAAGRLGPHGVDVLHHALSGSNMAVLSAGCQMVEHNAPAVHASGDKRPKFVALLALRKQQYPECMSALVALAALAQADKAAE